MLRLLPPIAVLGLTAALCYLIFWTEPEPRKMPRREILLKVEAKILQPTNYQVLLDSQGTVQARTESALVAEARGKIISISPNFRSGGFFEKGDLLAEIDPRDYETAVVIAEAALAAAELELVEEEARGRQAKVDWDRLHEGEQASDLVLRTPQLKQAQANVAATQARLANAELDLERTKIRAPYAGRILSKHADVGQFVSTGTPLATIYAVDYAEIRLPLNERQLEFFDVPEAYRGGNEQTQESQLPNVTLLSRTGNETYPWSGKIVRAEGAFDASSRQLFVIAQVDNPYAKREDARPPLKVGSFVQAAIEGPVLENVFVIPRELHRKNEYIVIIDESDRLERRSIEPIWSDKENLIVRSGIRPGERICLTPLRFPADGMKVAVVGENANPQKTGKPTPMRSQS